MSFWQQLRDVARMQIEDFFKVRAQTVLIMLGVVAALILFAYLRTT
jgi:hypothetical protein